MVWEMICQMAAVLVKSRHTGVNHQMAWETLTHACAGAIGLRN